MLCNGGVGSSRARWFERVAALRVAVQPNDKRRDAHFGRAVAVDDSSGTIVVGSLYQVGLLSCRALRALSYRLVPFTLLVDARTSGHSRASSHRVTARVFLFVAVSDKT
jgi:hypothetical protein